MQFDNKKPDEQGPETNEFTEIDSMVMPFDSEKPDSVLFHFFLNLLKGYCDKSWRLLTKYSQQKMLDGLYEEMENKDVFYFQNIITKKDDLRRAFEENQKDLKEQFWREFAINCSADYMVEYGEYRTKAIKNNKTIVEVAFKRIDGMETKVNFQMSYEDSSWRVAMVETANED